MIENNSYEVIQGEFREYCNLRNTKLIYSSENYDIKTEDSIKDFENLMGGRLDNNSPWGQEGISYNSAFVLKDCENIEIDGGGSRLTFHGLIQPFGLINCKNVILKNFILDWKRMPYSIGRVTKIYGENIEIDIFKDYPVSGGEPVWCLCDYDPVTRRMTDAWTYGSTTPMEYISPGLVRIKDSCAAKIKSGNWLIMQHIGLYRPGIHILDCEDIHLEGITMYSVPGMGIIGHRSCDISIRNLFVKPAEGMFRSVNRDATHFISCSGTIDFENCHFEGMGDDAVNVHGFYYDIIEVIDEYTVRIAAGRLTQDCSMEFPQVGDNMEFIDKINLKPYNEGKVKKVELDKKLMKVIIKFEEPLPETFCKEHILGNASQVAQLRFVNCTVKDNCARGVLIQTRGALVENCLFDHCTGTAIDINTAASWMESIGTRDVVIRNNKFLGCGYGLGNAGNASGIAIRTEAVEQTVGIHKNIIVENNLIEGVGNFGVYVSCTDGAKISGNKIYNCSSKVEITNSINVIVENVETMNI